VSAILKALRRVENESVQRSETPPVPKKLDAREAIRSEYRKRRTSQRILMVLLPVLSLAILVWVIMAYRPFLIPKSSTPQANSSGPRATPSAKTREPTSEDRRKRSEARPPDAPLVKEESAPLRGAREKEKKPVVDLPPAQKEGPSFQEPGFELQAIVWSEVPENRFAVINGVIVRAGGMIEGVSVTEIGKDDVSFKSGQRTWKMKMMRN